MIIKKPYAFLIKRFRLIHGILFTMLMFLLIKSIDIYTFFNDYATQHIFFNSGNLASNYISYGMFIVSILTILVSAVLYYILSLKNKNRGLYLFICIYYLIAFIYFLFIFSFLQKLETTFFNIETIRAIRDVSLIIVIPQLVFIFIIFGRALGFNIKKFDFKKDLEEMQIDKSDYEEVEVNLGNKNYKISRFFRKSLRLLKYFVIENKFAVILLSSTIVLVSSLVIFLNIKVYNIKYNERQEIFAHQLWYNISESYVTNVDMNGYVIKKGKSYILVKVKIDNKSGRDQTLERNTFRLELENKSILPTFTLSDKFLDLGEPYSSFTIKAGEIREKTVVFEINDKLINEEFILKIKNYGDNSNVGIESQYKDIIIKPKDLLIVKDSGKYHAPIEISFENTVLKSTKLLVLDHSIQKSFKEKYKYCLDNKCYNNTFLVRASSNNNNVVMKLNSSLTLDDSLFINKYITYPSDFYKYYATIDYRVYGVTKSIKANIISVDYDKEKATYIELPSEVMEANKIELKLVIRGIIYTIVLK